MNFHSKLITIGFQISVGGAVGKCHFKEIFKSGGMKKLQKLISIPTQQLERLEYFSHYNALELGKGIGFKGEQFQF